MAVPARTRRPRRPTPSPVVGALLALVAVVAMSSVGCRSTESTAVDGTVRGRLTVSAAASLSDVFAALRTAFETRYPQVRVTVNVGASSTLATQIIGGAPVDVFASADRPTMDRVVSADLVDGTPTVFATNSLQLLVRKGNPQGIRTLADLSRPDIVYVTCGPAVPIGAYATQVLDRAGVTVTPRSLEPDVKGIVTKVVAGEADAGIVYATDVTATNGAATGVDIPASANVTASYPIAVLADTADRSAAIAWVEFVLSDDGRSILRSFGFGVP